MPTYIVLGNFTDQGIRNVKDSPKREDAFRKLCEKVGAQGQGCLSHDGAL